MGLPRQGLVYAFRKSVTPCVAKWNPISKRTSIHALFTRLGSFKAALAGSNEKILFRFPFWALLRFKPFITLLQRAKKCFRVSQSWRSLGTRREGTFDGFQTRILFISVSSSSLLEPISVDDEESARSPRWKVLFVGTHHRLSCHAANANFSTFCCLSTRSALELRNSHLKRSFQLIIFPPSLALLSRASQTQSLLVSNPVHARCLPVYTLCSSLNGNFITYLAFSSFCLSIRFRQTGIAARRREKKAKHRTLQLMYDNYIYFSPGWRVKNNNKVVERRKGANFRKIRRKFLFFYFSSAAFESKYLQMRLNCRFLFHHPLFGIKFQFGRQGKVFGGSQIVDNRMVRMNFYFVWVCTTNSSIFGAMTLSVRTKRPPGALGSLQTPWLGRGRALCPQIYRSGINGEWFHKIWVDGSWIINCPMRSRYRRVHLCHKYWWNID